MSFEMPEEDDLVMICSSWGPDGLAILKLEGAALRAPTAEYDPADLEERLAEERRIYKQGLADRFDRERRLVGRRMVGVAANSLRPPNAKNARRGR